MNKDIELTEKDLYCIARHIQVYVFKKDDEVIKKCMYLSLFSISEVI